MRFWAQIDAVVLFMVSVRQAQRGTLSEGRSASHSLQPIDEFVMFLNYLAERFSVHQSTVSRIITGAQHGAPSSTQYLVQ